MHYEILDEKRKKLIKKICENNLSSGFYLAGGTALSLQLKLRESYDFDFFSEKPFNSELLLERIKKCNCGDIRVIQIGSGTLDLIIDDIQVSFLQYSYCMVKNPIVTDDRHKILIASPEDIAVMKFSAIGGRGSKKDFFDLYHIYKKVKGYNSYKLINDTIRKFGKERDLSYMVMGLTYFEDADTEKLPRCFVEYSWEDIKEFFRKEQTRIQEILF